jgi:hypothetical protein
MTSARELFAKAGIAGPLFSSRELTRKFGVDSLRKVAVGFPIQDFHRRTGGSLGPLGARVGGIRINEQGLYQQDYQLGHITMSNVGDFPKAFTTYEAIVTLSGVRCFGTEDPGGEDEPYVVITLLTVNPNFGGIDDLLKFTSTEILEGVTPRREVIFKERTLGRVRAFPGSGIKIHVAMFDHEHGDADLIREKIRAQAGEAVKSAAQSIAAAAAADDPRLNGPIGDLGEFEILGIKPFKLLTGFIADALGLGDDLIGEHEFIIPAANIAELTDPAKYQASLRTNPDLDPDVRYNWPRRPEEEVLFDRGGASYKIYFKIQGIGPIPVPLDSEL